MQTSIINANSNLKIFYASDDGIGSITSRNLGVKFYKAELIQSVTAGTALSCVTVTFSSDDTIHLTYIDELSSVYKVQYKTGSVSPEGAVTWAAPITIYETDEFIVGKATHILVNDEPVVIYQTGNDLFEFKNEVTTKLTSTSTTKTNVKVISDYDNNIYVFYIDTGKVQYVKYVASLSTWSQPFTAFAVDSELEDQLDVAVTVSNVMYIVVGTTTKVQLYRSPNASKWIRVSADNILPATDVYYPTVHLDCDQNINLFITQKAGDDIITSYVYSETGLSYSAPVIVKRFTNPQQSVQHAGIASVITTGDALNCSYIELDSDLDQWHVIFFKIVNGTYVPFSAIDTTAVPITPYFLPKGMLSYNSMPNIIETDDNQLQIYTYDKIYRRILMRYSYDYGNTWSYDSTVLALTQHNDIAMLKVIHIAGDTFMFFVDSGRIYSYFLGQYADSWSVEKNVIIDTVDTEFFVTGRDESSYDIVPFTDSNLVSSFVFSIFRRDLDTNEDYITIADVQLPTITAEATEITLTPRHSFTVNTDSSTAYYVDRRTAVAISASPTHATSDDWGVAIVYTDAYPLTGDDGYVEPIVNKFRTKVKFRTVTASTLDAAVTVYDHWINNELPSDTYTISPSICHSYHDGISVHNLCYTIPKQKVQTLRGRSSTELVTYGNVIPHAAGLTYDTVPKEVIIVDPSLNQEQLYLSRTFVLPINTSSNCVYIAAGNHVSIFGNTGTLYFSPGYISIDTDSDPDLMFHNVATKELGSYIDTRYYIDTKNTCISALLDNDDYMHICVTQVKDNKPSAVYSKWLTTDLNPVNYHQNIFPMPTVSIT